MVSLESFDETLFEDPVGSATLPGMLYTSQDVFELERAAIFERTWHFVGHANDLPLPGDYVTAMVADQGVFLTRGHDGEVCGFYNVCQHRGHELLRGAGRSAVIVCPYHAWSYSLDGRLRAAPGGGRILGLDTSAVRLSPVRVEQVCGLLFVNLDLEARPLSEQMPEFAQDLRSFVPGVGELVKVGEVRGVVAANWKLLIENSLECYHCSVVHRDFCESVDMSAYRSTIHGLFQRHLGPMRETDSSGRRIEGQYVYWHLWGTTELSVRTHSPVFSVYHDRPLGPDRTEVVLKTYSATNLSEPERQRIVHDYVEHNTTDQEDVSIVESVQRGLRSHGYRRGRFVVDANRSHISEHSVHHFQRLVAAALRGLHPGSSSTDTRDEVCPC